MGLGHFQVCPPSKHIDLAPTKSCASSTQIFYLNLTLFNLVPYFFPNGRIYNFSLTDIIIIRSKLTDSENGGNFTTFNDKDSLDEDCIEMDGFTFESFSRTV